MKKECEYCRKIFSSRKFLLDDTIDLGSYGKQNILLKLGGGEKNKGYNLLNIITMGTPEEDDGSYLVYKTPEINFCPMCGRKL